ncbi:AzlC family ABC transporter permease [Geobacter pickeringii]|uniref:AzlC family ABC transporter permease n=1 Tax=Geobacter pickeringii TaxID=345632 RepID=UPI000A67AF52|nr:AzlC family ABC transporter permease [Geobacter pickeringii]
MTTPAAPNPRPVLMDGLRTAWPICLGYFPIGLAFGVLAQKAGLSAWEIGLMASMVFAGGSQFIAVAMLQAGAPAVPIIATTFMVNLRHFLMSSSLSVHLRGSSGRFLALFAYGVTDESFAVNMGRFRDGGWDRWRALVVNHAANLVWIVCCVAGTWAGRFIPAGAFGIDYALTAMFICLLVFQLRSRLFTLTAVLAGLLSTALYVTLPGTVNVVAAAIAAATAGFWLRRRGRSGGRRPDADS